MGIRVELDAARSVRGKMPVATGPKAPPSGLTLQFWRRLIFGAVAEAKRTGIDGLPTCKAILARWWLEYRANPKDKVEWERSFECACERLGRDANVLRLLLLEQIDAALEQALREWAMSVVYVRRAMVLNCAGVATAIGRQMLLPLVDEEEWEDVAGVDHGDQYAMYDQREETAA